MVCAMVDRNCDKYVLCNIYRPPGTDLRLFCQALDNILLKIAADYSSVKCVIMSDFNFNLLHINSGSIAHEFLLSMYSDGYMPQILRPTRVARNSATLLDQI